MTSSSYRCGDSVGSWKPESSAGVLTDSAITADSGRGLANPARMALARAASMARRRRAPGSTSAAAAGSRCGFGAGLRCRHRIAPTASCLPGHGGVVADRCGVVLVEIGRDGRVGAHPASAAPMAGSNGASTTLSGHPSRAEVGVVGLAHRDGGVLGVERSTAVRSAARRRGRSRRGRSRCRGSGRRCRRPSWWPRHRGGHHPPVAVPPGRSARKAWPSRTSDGPGRAAGPATPSPPPARCRGDAVPRPLGRRRPRSRAVMALTVTSRSGSTARHRARSRPAAGSMAPGLVANSAAPSRLSRRPLGQGRRRGRRSSIAPGWFRPALPVPGAACRPAATAW